MTQVSQLSYSDSDSIYVQSSGTINKFQISQEGKAIVCVHHLNGVTNYH